MMNEDPFLFAIVLARLQRRETPGRDRAKILGYA
jgi:hypothetical protein